MKQKNKKGNLLLSLLCVGIIIFAGFYAIEFLRYNLGNFKENEKKYGISISDMEAKCLEFCKPDAYYFSEGVFSSDCECREIIKNYTEKPKVK